MVKRIIILSLFVWTAAAQDQTKDMERQKQILLTEIDNTKKLLNDNQVNTDNILNRLRLINQQVISRKQLIAILENETSILDKEIQAKNLQISRLEQNLKIKKNNYLFAVQKIYKHKTNQDQLLFILSGNDILQSFHRTLYLKRYINWSKKQAEEIAVQQNVINAQKAALNAQKKEKEKRLTNKRKEELQLLQEENMQKSEITNLKKDAKLLRSEIDKKKKQMNIINKEIEKIISEAMAASRKAAQTESSTIKQPENPRKEGLREGFAMTKEEQSLSADFAKNKGNLSFPLRGSYKIIRHFGRNSYEGLKNVVSNSNGIEIETTPGNTAKAVLDGIVSAVTIIPGAQTCILIKHGNYISFYSYLDQVFVKKGDIVKTGQDIGKIYSGDSTVLYFELRKERSKIDPESWLKK
jgi:septal ring factor EnvC (AmiA/AmiB activator)